MKDKIDKSHIDVSLILGIKNCLIHLNKWRNDITNLRKISSHLYHILLGFKVEFILASATYVILTNLFCTQLTA